MLAFGVIGALVLLLVYFAMRIQTLQREMVLLRSTTKSQTHRANEALAGLAEIVSRLEQVYAQNVDTAASKGLIGGQQHSVLQFLTGHFSAIVLDCWQNSSTTEEALKRQLAFNNQLSMEDLRAFMQQQPSQVRIGWSKNTPDGFISACESLTQLALGKQLKPK